MSKVNLKESLREIFSKFKIDPSVHGIKLEEVALETEGRLKDGTPVFTSADSFAIGVDVYTKDEEGNKVAAAAGRYELETGEFIDVNELGQIAEMGIPELEEVEMTSDDLLSAINKLSERVSTLEGEKAQLETELSNAKNEAAKTAENLSAVKAELSAVKKQPAITSVKDKPTTKVVLGTEKKEKSFSQMTLKERIQKNIENIKK
jgi:hypothetical protein